MCEEGLQQNGFMKDVQLGLGMTCHCLVETDSPPEECRIISDSQHLAGLPGRQKRLILNFCTLPSQEPDEGGKMDIKGDPVWAAGMHGFATSMQGPC